MAQRQFRSDDTSVWADKYGTGSDGAYAPSTSTDAPIDSACTGTASSNSLSATNASFATDQLLLIHQTQGTGAGNWELNKISSYSTGTITTVYPLINSYTTGAQVLVLKQYTLALIDTGVTLTAKAWNGTVGGIVALLANESITVTGNITTTGKGYTGGLASATVNTIGENGEGTAGAKSRTTNKNGNGGGGGAANGDGRAGAGGGNGAAGTAGYTAGQGGDSVGNTGLTTMVFGGGGGSGGQDDGSPDGNNHGGAGGGIVLLIGKTITVSGTIVSGGNNGVNSNASYNGAGGGGAGGSILLKGQNLTLGSTKITALAGSSGTGSTPAGGAGAVGRIHADYSSTITGTTTPTIDTRQDLALRTGNMFMVFD